MSTSRTTRSKHLWPSCVQLITLFLGDDRSLVLFASFKITSEQEEMIKQDKLIRIRTSAYQMTSRAASFSRLCNDIKDEPQPFTHTVAFTSVYWLSNNTLLL